MPFAENDRWPRDPYKGLANYESEDEDLFAGRNAEIDACAQLLANAQTKLLILHGQTGCGKSSFLRAGLIPAIERNGAGYFFLRRRSLADPTQWKPSFIRCGADPLSRIAEEIFAFTAQPVEVRTATGPKSIDLASARFGINRPDAFVSACADPHRLLKILERLSLLLPHTLVLILDQVEEVITLNSSKNDNQARLSRFIKELVASDIDMRFVLAIRKDHSGQFIGSIQVDNEISAAFRTFFLSDLSKAGIREAILRPTLRSLPENPTKPAPFDHYQFAFAPAAVDAILDDLEALIPAGATLPVMQIVCRDLYEQVSALPAPRLIDLSLYKQGEIKGRVKRHLMTSLRGALHADKKRGNEQDQTELKWLRVLNRLVLKEGDGRVHTDMVPRTTLEEWAADERIDGSVGEVVDALTDPKVLVLRKFAIFAPGSMSERELFSLGHDMIGIALGEALRDAEERRSVNDAVRERSILMLVVSACLIALAFYASWESSMRRQSIESLLAKASKSRADNVLASIDFATQAEALAQQTVLGFEKDGRPGQALMNLTSGLPIIALAGQSAPPLDRSSSIYPTYALPKRVGFAILRAGGVLEVDTIANGAVLQETFKAPEPLQITGRASDLQSLSFSEASPSLLLAMYVPSEMTKSGGVAAFSRRREPKLFSYDDLIEASGSKDASGPKFLLYGLSGDSIVLYSLSEDKKSVHLKSLVVSDSLELRLGINHKMPAPSGSPYVAGRRLVSFFYRPVTGSAQGGPSVTQFESNDIFGKEERSTWQTNDFPSVKQCLRQAGRACDVTAVGHLQQTDLVVLGLSELVQGRFDQYQKAVPSNLMIVDLDSRATTEVDLRVAAAARQECGLTGSAAVATGRSAGDNAQLRDEDVPTFLVKAQNGVVLGYASRTSAQLIHLSAAAMTCTEIFFPDVEMAGWTSDSGGKLFAASRDAGFVWDLQPKAGPASDISNSDQLKKLCASVLPQFVGRADEPPGRAGGKEEEEEREKKKKERSERQQLLDKKICPNK
jgi:hypothetical protein